MPLNRFWLPLVCCLRPTHESVLYVPVLLQPDAPWTFIDGNASSTGIANTKFTGFGPDLAAALFARMSVTTAAENGVLLLPAYSALPAATYAGTVNAVQNHAAALFAGDVTITVDRVQAGVVYTVPFLGAHFSILSKQKSEPISMWRFLSPFAWDMWVCLLAAALVLGLGMWVTDKFSPFGYRAQFKQVQMRRRLNPLSAIYSGVMMLLNKEPVFARAASTRTVAIAGFFLFFFIYKTYIASLTLLLSVQTLVPTVASFNQLQGLRLPFAVLEKSADEDFFTSSTDPNVAVLAASMVPVPTQAAAIALLRAGTVAAFVGSSFSLSYLSLQQPCDLIAVDTALAPSFVAFTYDAAYWSNVSLLGGGTAGGNASASVDWSPLLSASMAELIADGTVENLREAYFESVREGGNAGGCDPQAATQLVGTPIDLSNMQGSSYAFLIVFAAALAMLGTEYCVFAQRHSRHWLVRKVVKAFGFHPEHDHHLQGGSRGGGGKGGGGGRLSSDDGGFAHGLALGMGAMGFVGGAMGGGGGRGGGGSRVVSLAPQPPSGDPSSGSLREGTAAEPNSQPISSPGSSSGGVGDVYSFDDASSSEPLEAVVLDPATTAHILAQLAAAADIAEPALVAEDWGVTATRRSHRGGAYDDDDGGGGGAYDGAGDEVGAAYFDGDEQANGPRSSSGGGGFGGGGIVTLPVVTSRALRMSLLPAATAAVGAAGTSAVGSDSYDEDDSSSGGSSEEEDEGLAAPEGAAAAAGLRGRGSSRQPPAPPERSRTPPPPPHRQVPMPPSRQARG